MEAGPQRSSRGGRKVADARAAYATQSPEQLLKNAQKLEKQMLRHARDLEFEEAARLRDQIHEMREAALGLSDRLAG
jgi:excinuclease ABC subunit B